MNRKHVAAGQRQTFNVFIIAAVAVIAVTSIVWSQRTTDLKVLASFDGTSIGTPPATIPLTTEDFRVLPDTGYIDLLTSRVEGRLPAYEAEFANLAKVADGVYIDIILQAHDFFGASEKEVSQARRSQKRILHQLERGQYDLVVIEGQSLDKLTRNAIRAQVMEYAREMGMPIYPLQFEQGYKMGLPLDAGLTYMEENPDRWVAGGEDPDLNQLHDRLLNGEFSSLGPLDTLSVKMRITRSIIPMTRTINLLNRSRQHRAALIIGAAHGPEMEHLMRTIGIRGRILDAWK